MALGGETLSEQTFELFNSTRVERYVTNWNKKVRQGDIENGKCIDWLSNCEDCEEAEFLFTNGEGYFLPEVDPAPWYNPAAPVRDSEKFFGVMGLEVSGGEDSTRSATVKASVAGGGAISRLRYEPRMLVVRGLAVAADSCGMEVGLNWMRCQYEIEIDECGKDYLWFLDCCPQCATDKNAPPVAPCWPDTYEELANGPADCPDGTCWVANYDEFAIGPNGGGFDTCGWCAWIDQYRDFTDGLPQFACNLQECLVPYLRQFQTVRVIEGPLVLNHQTMSDGSVICEVEFTIACADPHPYSPEVEVLSVQTLPAVVQHQDALEPEVKTNPFMGRSRPQVPRGPSLGLDLPGKWHRSTIGFTPDHQTTLPNMVPSIMLAAPAENAGLVRVGVWKDGELVNGYVLPFVPATGLVKVNSKTRQIYTEYEGQGRTMNGFARMFNGDGIASWADMDIGEEYTVTVDQEEGQAVELLIEVAVAGKGCA